MKCRYIQCLVLLCTSLLASLALAVPKAARPDPAVLVKLRKLSQLDQRRLLHEPTGAKKPPFVYYKKSKKRHQRSAGPKRYPLRVWDDLYDEFLSEVTYKQPPRGEADGQSADTSSRDALSRLPQLAQHSALQVTVPAGTRVRFAVDLKEGQNAVMFSWEFGGEVVCQVSSCTIETGILAPGNHKVYAQIYNRAGGYLLEFAVNVTFRKPDAQAQELVVPMVAATAQPHLFSDQDYILARSGRGYSSRGEAITVVDRLVQALRWSETLRTNAGGVLRFGRKGLQEHFLLGNSVARLAHKAGYFAVKLTRGVLRSRGMSRDPVVWKVLIKGGIEIDGDAAADVVSQVKLSKGRQVTKAICLRGYCRIVVPKNHLSSKAFAAGVKDLYSEVLREEGYLEEGDKILTYHLAAGDALTIVAASERLPLLVVPQAGAISSVLRVTTPEYLSLAAWPAIQPTPRYLGFLPPVPERKYFMDDFEPLHPRLGFLGPAAVDQVARYLQEHDPFKALEVLSQFPRIYSAHSAYKLVLGQIYLRLHAQQRAAELLAAAARDERYRDLAVYAQGMQKLAARAYGKACSDLATIDPDVAANLQLLAYYRGVCSYFSDGAGEVSFARSLWYPEDAAFVKSAQEFLRAQQAARLFALTLEAGIYRDSRPLNNGAADPNLSILPETEAPSLHYRGRVKAKGRIAADEVLESYYGVALYYGGYQDAYYQAVAAITDLRIFVDNKLRIGGAANPVAEITGNIFVGRLGRGDQAAVDGFGTDLGAALSRISWQPGVRFHTGQYFDPQPLALHVMDPVLAESAPATSRASRVNDYGLVLVPIEAPGLKKLQVDLGIRRHRMTTVASQGQSYDGMFLVADYSQNLARIFSIASKVSYETLDFFNSQDEAFEVSAASTSSAEPEVLVLAKRADSRLSFWGEGRWFTSPDASLGVGVEFVSSQSSREQNSFSKLVFGANYRLEF